MAETKYSEFKQLYVGIDVGGTTVKEGLFTAAGELLDKVAVPTPPLTDEHGYAAVTGGIRQLLANARVEPDVLRGIGLAVPCPVPESGEVTMAANVDLDFPGLTKALNDAFSNAAVRFENDANAAALGEVWQGAASGKKSMVFITLGTGVGGGVVIDGHIVGGVNGAGGEIGHMNLNPAEDRVCGCGRRGCLEQYSSATGVVSNYRMACAKRGQDPAELLGPSDSRTVFDLCRAGDECAVEAMEVMTEYLGRAMSILAATVDPESFVLGGGTSNSADLFMESLVKYYQQYAIDPVRDTPIEIASLGNDAGIIGAGYVALQAAYSAVSEK